MKKSLAALVVMALVGAAGWYVYSQFLARPAPDPEAVRLSRKNPGPGVENGWAYDRATLPLPEGVTPVIPDFACRLEDTAPPGVLEIYMEKELHLREKPEKPTSIRAARKEMGCAVRKEDNKIVLATYGEIDSYTEGGRLMSLLVRVPPGTIVEPRPELSGPIRATTLPGAPTRKVPTPGEDGWEAVPSEFDPAMTASTTSRNYE